MKRSQQPPFGQDATHTAFEQQPLFEQGEAQVPLSQQPAPDQVATTQEVPRSQQPSAATHVEWSTQTPFRQQPTFAHWAVVRQMGERGMVMSQQPPLGEVLTQVPPEQHCPLEQALTPLDVQTPLCRCRPRCMRRHYNPSRSVGSGWNTRRSRGHRCRPRGTDRWRYR